MTKPNYNKIHGGMAILFFIVMANALGVKFVETKSSKHLKNMYLVKQKGTVKTIEIRESGDVTDCIDIYKQPAFDRPILKIHTIQMKPTSCPKGTKVKKFQKRVLVEVDCPIGTVPIMRRRDDIGDGKPPFITKKNPLNHSYNVEELHEDDSTFYTQKETIIENGCFLAKSIKKLKTQRIRLFQRVLPPAVCFPEEFCKFIQEMTKPNYNRIHGGMALFLAVVTANALGVEFVEAKSSRHSKTVSSVQQKGIVKTIKSDESGDVIDCVDIYKQPAFNHPLLKNHTIQMKPTSYPKGTNLKKFQEKVLVEVECPKGTIPIKRRQNHIGGQALSGIAKGKTFYHRSYDIKDLTYASTHEYAEVSLEGGKYYGAHAVINVWEPATEFKEASFSQIWVVSGGGGSLNTVEAGWMVNRPKYKGNNETRFFVYWTADSYSRTGCYNLECPGFVQVNKKYVLDGLVRPISRYNARQFEIIVSIHQDKGTKNWWLRLQDEDLGYWPASLFTTLGGGATIVSWGGEIVDTRSDFHHTTTQMGSGHFPSEGFKKASFFRVLKYVDAGGNQKDADGLIKFVSKSSCYDLQLQENKHDKAGANFYYGGPGYSAQCL